MAGLEGLSTQDLAHRFVDATIDQWGVNRDKVEEVLAEVQRRGAKEDFKNVLWSFGNLHGKTHDKYMEVMARFKKFETPGDALVPAILRDELSGEGLRKALGIWNGQPVESGGGWANFVQGVRGGIDGMGTVVHQDIASFVDGHPYAAWAMATGGGTALRYGGAAVGVVGTFLGIGAAGMAGKHAIDGATTRDPAEAAAAWRKSGAASLDAAAALVPAGAGKVVSKIASAVKGGAAVTKGLPVVAAAAGAVSGGVGGEASAVKAVLTLAAVAKYLGAAKKEALLLRLRSLFGNLGARKKLAALEKGIVRLEALKGEVATKGGSMPVAVDPERFIQSVLKGTNGKAPVVDPPPTAETPHPPAEAQPPLAAPYREPVAQPSPSRWVDPKLGAADLHLNSQQALALAEGLIEEKEARLTQLVSELFKSERDKAEIKALELAIARLRQFEAGLPDKLAGKKLFTSDRLWREALKRVADGRIDLGNLSLKPYFETGLYGVEMPK